MFRKVAVFAVLLGITLLTIPVYALGLDSVEISGARLSNAFGASLGDRVNIGQQVVITADVKNNLNESQEFIFIYQVKDESGRVVSLDWITGILSPGQSLNAARSWIPENAGNYTAEVFVWDNLIKRNALDEFKTIEIIVS